MKRQAVIFDVNETMLDVRDLDLIFTEWFGDAGSRAEWFSQTLHYALTLAATLTYRSFAAAGAAALGVLALRRDRVLPEDAASRLRTATLSLSPHPDVSPALRVLREAGYVTAALSNNPTATLRAQMRHAELDGLFDDVMSVDEAGALKPAPEVYRFAVDRLNVRGGDVWMVAAHGWDIAGAMRCGLRGAFVARPGQSPDPFAVPEIMASNLVDLADEIRAIGHRPE